MIEIETVGWYIFLIVAAAIILFFNWMFLKETRKIQEKMKGMKSFGDIIDATNQALDEFNTAFAEAGDLIEKRREELMALVKRAEGAIEKLDKMMVAAESDASSQEGMLFNELPSEPIREPEVEPQDEDRVEAIKRCLAEGKSTEDISRLTGASIREVRLVEKFSNSR